jgi:hypothetical protein
MKHGVLIDKEAIDNLIAYLEKCSLKGGQLWGECIRHHVESAPAAVVSVEEAHNCMKQ